MITLKVKNSKNYVTNQNRLRSMHFDKTIRKAMSNFID